MQHRRLTKPTFQFFTEWLEEWADISRINRDTHTSKPTQSHIETPQFNKSLIKTPSNFNSRSTVQSPKQVQRSSSRDSQRSNPGDRDFRDTVRKLHKNTPSNTNYKNQQVNPGENPYRPPFRVSRNQDRSPSTSKPKCAWCTDNGLAHNHVTPDCAMLQNANAIDQWKFLFNHQLCDSFLLPGHHWRQCKNKAQDSCPNCGNSCLLYTSPSPRD